MLAEVIPVGEKMYMYMYFVKRTEFVPRAGMTPISKGEAC